MRDCPRTSARTVLKIAGPGNWGRVLRTLNYDYPEHAGPPKHLNKWLGVYQFGEELEPIDKDNVAEKGGKVGRKRRHVK